MVPSTRTSHNRIPYLLLSCGTSSERPGKPVVLTEKACSSPADSRWYFFLLTMLPVRRNLSWRSGLFRVRNRNLVASQASQRCLELCGGSPLMSLAVASTPSGSNYQLPQRGLSSAAAETTHQRIKGRRRFYKEVTIREKEAGVAGGRGDARGEASTGKRWEVLLDNRVLKTPARRPLEFDTADLAMAVASEWDAQTSSKGIEPALMPLMSLASTAIDQVALDREKTISTCLKYLPTDTVCFLSPEPDPVITRRQRQLWSPIREWSEEALGIPVATTTEIHRKPEHPPEASFRARELLESLDEWALSAVQSVTMECKSLLIALALVLRKTTAEKAFDAARLEEEYNVERWGMIEGGHDMDRANTTLTLTAASTLMWLRPINLSKEPSPAQLP